MASVSFHVTVRVPTWRFRVAMAWARFCGWSCGALLAWAERGIRADVDEGSR